MKCEFCNGTGKVTRMRPILRGECYSTVMETVTCPSCIRGISVLGTHELLRDYKGNLHEPGEPLDGYVS